MPLPRLTHPLVRKNGVLVRASWDEALDVAARGLEAEVKRHGPNTFGIFSCSKATNEVNYAAQKFLRMAVGIEQHRQLQQNLTRPQRRRSGDGLRSRWQHLELYREAEETDVIFLWGSNAREAHPIYFHHVLKGVHRGARLFVVDPRRTSSAEWADGFAQLHVGSDISLANGMGRSSSTRASRTQPFIANATENFEAYRATVAPLPARARGARDRRAA